MLTLCSIKSLNLWNVYANFTFNQNDVFESYHILERQISFFFPFLNTFFFFFIKHFVDYLKQQISWQPFLLFYNNISEKLEQNFFKSTNDVCLQPIFAFWCSLCVSKKLSTSSFRTAPRPTKAEATTRLYMTTRAPWSTPFPTLSLTIGEGSRFQNYSAARVFAVGNFVVRTFGFEKKWA